MIAAWVRHNAWDALRVGDFHGLRGRSHRMRTVRAVLQGPHRQRSPGGRRRRIDDEVSASRDDSTERDDAD
jgi:hypothetical protein